MSQTWLQNGMPYDLKENVVKIAGLVWDENSQSWVKMTQPGAAPVEPVRTTLIDQPNATTMYLGKAPIGSAEASAVWQIRKVTFNANGDAVSVQFASGGASTNVWSDRASLSYA